MGSLPARIANTRRRNSVGSSTDSPVNGLTLGSTVGMGVMVGMGVAVGAGVSLGAGVKVGLTVRVGSTWAAVGVGLASQPASSNAMAVANSSGNQHNEVSSSCAVAQLHRSIMLG